MAGWTDFGFGDTGDTSTTASVDTSTLDGDYGMLGYTPFDLFSGGTGTDTTSLSNFNWDGLDKTIGTVGATFASTYNAVNHPTYGSAYNAPAPMPSGGAPQGMGANGGPPMNSSGGSAPAGVASDFMANITNFSTPYPYVAIGGTLLVGIILVRLMSRR